MSKTLCYKGYRCVIERVEEDSTLWGRIIDTDSLLVFQCTDPNNAEASFHSAVDEYLQACKDAGIDPVKPGL